MKISIPSGVNPIGEMVSELKKCKNEDARKAITYEIDREVYKLYGLSSRQIEIINSNE